MIQGTRVLRTYSLDPFHNLALEEFLLDDVTGHAAAGCHAAAGYLATLYLWQNENTVVIGKNQNPWRECRLEQLEAEGGKLARRLSGGGAVFHDLGNLNFTFLLPRADYDLSRQLRVILEAARAVGVPAEMSGRNDLTATGRKFSGNAFYLRKETAFHHGTILVNADFQKMSRYLQPSAEKMRAKGVESVRARVVNLSELSPGLGVVQF
ncbi:MAG: lipoate--protein ligase, partial [bacterium]